MKRKALAVAGAAAGTTLIALLVTSSYTWVTTAIVDRPPLTAVLEPGFGLECEDLVVSAPKPSSLPARDRFGAKWAYENRGGTLDKDGWSLTLQGRGDQAVVLHGIDVVDIERLELPVAPEVVSKCGGRGGSLDARYFSLDFGKVNVRAVPQAGSSDGEEATDPPVTFPYTVSKADPELFHFEVRGPDCLCSYRLSVRWSSGEEAGTLLIDRGFDKIRNAVIDSDRAALPFNEWGDGGEWQTY